MERFALLIFFLLGSFALIAQQTIRGTVRNGEKEPLVGAVLLVKGTTTGTLTDDQGAFSIEVPKENATLVISYTGYVTQERVIQSNALIAIVLERGVALEEIIVTGQGVGLERKRLSTMVDVLTTRELETASIFQLDQVIQSRLPGSQIRFSSGQPGTASLIRNRGPISASSATTPVIIVDGIRMDNLNGRQALSINTGGAQSSALADLPIEGIERVEFIRSGAATTLYGADAANGVLQIFTKKGSQGPGRVYLETQVGSIRGERAFLHFDQTADLYYEPGLAQQYRAVLDGGNESVQYNFSGSFYADNSFNAINEQQRLSFHTGLNAQISSTLSYTAAVGFTSNYYTRDFNANSNFARFGPLEYGDFGDLTELSDTAFTALDSLLQEQAQQTDISEAVRRVSVSNQFQWRPLPNLTARFTFGFDNRSSRAENLQTNALLIAKGAVVPGTNDQGNTERVTRNFLALTTDLSLQYTLTTEAFSFITSVGGQFFREHDEQYQFNASNLIDGSSSLNNAADVAVEEVTQTIAFGGLYLAESIGFQDKLFMDAAIRWDFNSAFGEDIGMPGIYRVGLTYALSEETFIQDGALGDVLSRWRIRANYGQATNFPSPFASDQTLSVSAYLEGLNVNISDSGNASLGPEKVESFEVGTDLSLFSSRLGLRFTYYNTVTRDAIFVVPFPPSSGLINQQANVGEIENTGIEIQTSIGLIQQSDLSLTLNGSITTNTNLVTSTGGAEEFGLDGFDFLGSFVKEGLPLGYFRGSQPIFDTEGNLIEVDENTVLGDPNPNAYGVVGLNVRWERFSAFLSADYQLGAQGVNVDDVFRYANGLSVQVPENAIGAFTSDLGGVWVEDTDFLKVRNLGLAYEVPVQGTALRSLQIGLQLRNPLVWSAASFDPEITGAGLGTGQGALALGGFGFGTESLPRQYFLTIKLGL